MTNVEGEEPKKSAGPQTGASEDHSEYGWDDSKWIVPPYKHWEAGNSDYQADESSYWRSTKRAIWANVAIGICTLFAAIAAGRIAWFAYQSSMQALTEARKQVIEAKRQADAAESQIAVTKDIEERQLRAYVVVRAQDKLDNFVVGGKAHAQGILDNVGQTPVYNSTVSSGIAVLDYPLKGPIAFTTCNAIMAMSDARRHFFGKESFPGKDRDTPFTDEEITKIKDGKSAIYYYGKVCYGDIFQKVRHSEFCIFWNWSGNSISGAQYCEHGNTADEPETGPWPPTSTQPPTSPK